MKLDAVQKVRDRVVGFRRVRAGDLKPHPKNWRTHPKAQQEELRGVLAEIGFADAVLVRELPDKSLQLIDGHLRAEMVPDMEVPCLILDLDDAEAAKLLATLDPISAMAGSNDALLAELLADTCCNDLIADVAGRTLRDASDASDASGPRLVTIAVLVSDVAAIEDAMARTLKPNRGEALAEICRAFTTR